MGRTTNKQRRDQQAATARARAAAARAEQKRQEQRRRAMTIIGSVIGVAVLVVAIAVVAITHKGGNDAKGDRTQATASVVKAVTTVPAATLTKVGKGNVLTPPAPVSGQPPLTAGGKPELLYIGAEFCPYCAVERWSLATALSKFGTLGNLGMVHSATTDGNYASLDFLNSTYNSKYLTFTPIENEDRERNVIEKPTSAQATLWNTLDKGDPGYPFISFGNKSAITVSAPLDPSVLGTLTQQQIATAMHDPTSKVAQVVDGGANYDIAAICSMTGNKPASVCSAPAIGPLQSQING